MIASHALAVTGQDRKAIWESLSYEETCPRHDLLLLAETLTFCSELHRALDNEWAAFANLIAYRQKTEKI
jgi:hypothetical protein